MLAAAVAAYLVIVGMLAGSFINLAADRLPRGESVVRPRSHCRGCRRQLNAIDLLPVVGYLLRGGRCATCKTPIGVTSPLVEAVCGGCMVTTVATLGVWSGAAAGLALITVLGLLMTGIGFQVQRSSRAEP